VQGKHTLLFTSISNRVDDLVKPPLPADAASFGVIVFDLVNPCGGALPSFDERNENLPKVFLISGEGCWLLFSSGEGWWLDDEKKEGWWLDDEETEGFVVGRGGGEGREGRWGGGGERKLREK